MPAEKVPPQEFAEFMAGETARLRAAGRRRRLKAGDFTAGLSRRARALQCALVDADRPLAKSTPAGIMAEFIGGPHVFWRQ
jgi:hypothetical protein